MQIELTTELQQVLEQRAAEAGMSASSYISSLLENQALRPAPEQAASRSALIDRFLEQTRHSSATSGRGVQEWREFIHEGHKK